MSAVTSTKTMRSRSALRLYLVAYAVACAAASVLLAVGSLLVPALAIGLVVALVGVAVTVRAALHLEPQWLRASAAVQIASGTASLVYGYLVGASRSDDAYRPVAVQVFFGSIGAVVLLSAVGVLMSLNARRHAHMSRI